MTGNCRNNLIPRGEKNPAVKIQFMAAIQKRFNDAVFLPQVWHANPVSGVTGEARNGMLVVDNTNRDTDFSEAAYDAETLVITPNDNGAGGARGERRFLV